MLLAWEHARGLLAEFGFGHCGVHLFIVVQVDPAEGEAEFGHFCELLELLINLGRIFYGRIEKFRT